MAWPRSKKIDKVHGECVQVYDNGGKTMDRYTVIIGCRDAAAFAMSEHPEHPQGVGMYVGQRSEYPMDMRRGRKKISFNKLPKDVRNAIRHRIDYTEE